MVGQPYDPGDAVRGAHLVGDVIPIQANDVHSPPGHLVEGGAPHSPNPNNNRIVYRHDRLPSNLVD